MTAMTASPRLFEPLTLRGITLPNRIGVSPMCQYSAVEGRATDWHLVHLGGLAQGGAGLVIAEATAVSPEGRISPEDLGLWEDGQIEPLARITAFIASQRAVPGIQLAHAGRKACTPAPWRGASMTLPLEEGGWIPAGPSALPFDEGWTTPTELSEAEIARLIGAFREATQRALEAGFQVVELHAAHGYLLHEFLSPLSNRRTDDYGGSLENRMRLVLEIFADLRGALPPQMPLGVRISATDWVEGGWDVAQSIELTRRLKDLGAAYIHVSSGGLAPEQQITLGPGYQVPFAEAIRKATGLTTIAVGLITEAGQAEGIVSSGQADAVALARAMLYDPRWPWHAAALLGAQAECPPQYLRCQPHGLKALLKNNGRG
jgi:2,4-dienoyl-CoA reductase-like NADH-dependent reductase (Old Yellow Enzyme family)